MDFGVSNDAGRNNNGEGVSDLGAKVIHERGGMSRRLVVTAFHTQERS